MNDRLDAPHFPVADFGDKLSLLQYGSSALASTDPIGVPILRMNNLQDDGWDLSNLKYLEANEAELDRYRLVTGDILFNRTNSKELVGKCAVFRETGDWLFASYLIRIRTDEGQLNPQFVSDYLSTRIGRLQIDRLSRQIIGMTNINADEIRALRIPLPSVSEQAEFVAEMDAARAERQRQLAEADELFTGVDGFLIETLGLTRPAEDDRRVFGVRRSDIIQDGRFDPGYHAPEFAHIQRMRNDTPCEALGEIVRFSTQKWKPEEANEPSFRYIEISTVNVTTGEATWTEVPTAEAPSRARMTVQEDDIIVSLTRPHHGSIAHLSAEFDGCIASTGFAVIREVSDRVRRDYLWSVLRAQFSLRQMYQRSSGGNYPAITEEQLLKVVVPVPDPEVQEAVATEVQRRRVQARRLREEAAAGWEEAKLRFEEQLLGGPTP